MVRENADGMRKRVREKLDLDDVGAGKQRDMAVFKLLQQNMEGLQRQLQEQMRQQAVWNKMIARDLKATKCRTEVKRQHE